MTPPASQSALTRHAITFIIARALAACLTLAAVVAQYSQSLAFWLAHDENIGFRTTNFFSFFTIESNLIAMITLAIGAVLLMRGRTIDPQWFAVLRASAITYMVTTGIVYNILLRNETLSQGVTVWWSNEVLHLIVPIYMVVDWLFAPGARRVQWRTVFYVAAFPVVWVAYTMLRGPLAIDPFTGVGWYPYPFLQPANGGYGSVMVYIVIIAVAIVVVATGVVAVWRRNGASDVRAAGSADANPPIMGARQ